MRHKKVLVTGGAGFIGSHVVDLLHTQGVEVAIVDNCSSNSSKNNAPSYASILREVDIRDAAGLERVFEEFKPDAVMHLAAQVDVGTSMRDPATSYEINVGGSGKVCNAAIKTGVERVVYASTYCVYGSQKDLPVTEEHEPHPKSVYGISKYMGEQEFLSALGSIEVFISRGSNTLGPRQAIAGSYGGVIPRFVESILDGVPAQLRGNGRPIRDYICVAHAAEFLTMGLTAPPGTYNYGSGRGMSVEEIWNKVAGEMEARGYLIPVPEKTSLMKGEIMDMVISAEKARQAFGWQPQLFLDDCLVKTIDYIEFALSRRK